MSNLKNKAANHPMGRKQLFLYSVLLSLVSFATAQGGITQDQQQTGIIPLMAQLLGVPINEITTFWALGFLSATALMTLFVYGILRTAILTIAENTGSGGDQLKKSFGLGYNGEKSSRLLIAISLLIVLTAMGAIGTYELMVLNLQALILLAMGAAILSGLLYLLAGSLIAGGWGLQGAAAGVDEVNKGAKHIGKTLDKIGKEEKEIGREIGKFQQKEDSTERKISGKDGGIDAREVVPETAEQLKMLEDIESKIETVENNMEKVLSEVKEEEDMVLRQQKKEERGLEKAQRLEADVMRDLQSFLNNLDERLLSQGDAPQRIIEDLKQQNQQLKEIEELIKLEASVHKEVDSLIRQLKGLKNSLSRLDKEIQKLESEEQELEDEEKREEKLAEQGKMSNMDGEVRKRLRNTEKETKKARNELQKIVKERNRLEQELNSLMQELKQERNMDKTEIRELKQILSELRQEESALDKIRRAVREHNQKAPSEEGRKIENAVGEMEKRIERIESEAQKMLGGE